MPTAIDCQSFAGGFALGVVNAGFTIVAKRENETGFGVEAMTTNRHLLGNTWQVETCDPDQWTATSADLVFGNPPCSGFSNASLSYPEEWRRAKDANMWDLISFAAKCNSKVVIFESVQGAYRSGIELMRELFEKLCTLTGKPWKLYHVLHNVKDLGGAQNRARYFWVASLLPFGVAVPGYSGETVAERIEDLGPANGINGHEVLGAPRGSRLASLAATGLWHEGERSGRAHERAPDIELDQPDRTNSGFSSVRLIANKPSRVLSGAALEGYVHPTQPRTLTYREVARLSGLPDTWNVEAYQKKNFNTRWFGKGVCVEAGQWIADAAFKAIIEQPYQYQGISINNNEYLIDVQSEQLQDALF
jgi:site-specific DNA-cytosine methylase